MKKTKIGDVGSIVLADCEVLEVTDQDGSAYPMLKVSTPIGQFEISDTSFVVTIPPCSCGKRLAVGAKLCHSCGKANPDAGA